MWSSRPRHTVGTPCAARAARAAGWAAADAAEAHEARTGPGKRSSSSSGAAAAVRRRAAPRCASRAAPPAACTGWGRPGRGLQQPSSGSIGSSSMSARVPVVVKRAAAARAWKHQPRAHHRRRKGDSPGVGLQGGRRIVASTWEAAPTGHKRAPDLQPPHVVRAVHVVSMLRACCTCRRPSRGTWARWPGCRWRISGPGRPAAPPPAPQLQRGRWLSHPSPAPAARAAAQAPAAAAADAAQQKSSERCRQGAGHHGVQEVGTVGVEHALQGGGADAWGGPVLPLTAPVCSPSVHGQRMQVPGHAPAASPAAAAAPRAAAQSGGAQPPATLGFPVVPLV